MKYIKSSKKRATRAGLMLYSGERRGTAIREPFFATTTVLGMPPQLTA